MVDKNQAVINFLMQCPQIRDNPTYFNFTDANAEGNSKSIITSANDKSIDRTYVDGSVLKRFTFTIIDFKSVSYQALTTVAGLSNENVEDMMDVQSIMDWVEEQADNRNYPDFGQDCVMDNMRTATNAPNLNGVDTNSRPSLAKYSMSIIIDYLDTSKRIWQS